MSGKYTHKIILFSEEGFTGDAQVVMKNTITNINFSVDGIYQSAIIEKGGWGFCWIENSGGGMNNVTNEAAHVRPVYGEKCILIPQLKRFNWLECTLETQ